MRTINLIVIHCSATRNGKWLGVEDIDAMHGARRPPFNRDPKLIGYNQPRLKHIGYHYVVYTSGAVTIGRGLDEPGEHVAGHNFRSIGICMPGTDAYASEQWSSLRDLVCASIATIAKRRQLDYAPRYRPTPIEAIDIARRMGVTICGHRDLSPDLDGDGTVEPHEWLKTCPGFDVGTWLARGMTPLPVHVLEVHKTSGGIS